MSKTENQALFSNRRKELIDRQLSNSEAQDKAILMLSSSGLAISISLIRFVVKLETATHTWLLYGSWFLFALAAIFTILSYLVGQKAIDDSIEVSYKYYIEDNDEYENITPKLAIINDWINISSSIIFIGAVVFIVIFTTINVHKEECPMAKDQRSKVTIQESAKVPTMEKKSAKVPKQEPKSKPKSESNKK